jgi:hypothetical protein
MSTPDAKHATHTIRAIRSRRLMTPGPARINYKTIGDDAMPLSIATMQRKITGFHLDEEGHWVAELECGHNQHVRHDPPYVERPWVITEHGRRSRLGQELNCVRCDEDRCGEGACPGKAAKVTRLIGAALLGSGLPLMRFRVRSRVCTWLT